MQRSCELADGTPIIIRRVRPSDRHELAAAYEALSPESRRLRFFSPPTHLSEALLDYLTDLDFVNRFALVARTADDERGLGIARWIRDREQPEKAAAAVTVADDWQGRGIGTQLLLALVEDARAAGIRTFVAEVLWDNQVMLDPLRRLGADIAASEPGVARVEVDLPDAQTFGESALRQMLHTAARHEA